MYIRERLRRMIAMIIACSKSRALVLQTMQHVSEYSYTGGESGDVVDLSPTTRSCLRNCDRASRHRQ